MKITRYKFTEVLKKEKSAHAPILFFGDDESGKRRLVDQYAQKIKNDMEIEAVTYFDFKKQSINDLMEICSSASLFQQNDLIIVNNASDHIIKLFEEKNEISQKYFILVSGSLTNRSKLRLFFEKHVSFLTLPCYPLSKKDLDSLLFNYLNINNIKANNETLLYLKNNLSSNYDLFFNEVEKLKQFKNGVLDYKKVIKLISYNRSSVFDEYFFYCAEGDLLKISDNFKKQITSENHVYELCYSIKRLTGVLLSCALFFLERESLEESVNKYFPRYLFQKKIVFTNLLKKIIVMKIYDIYEILQKTEVQIRKNRGVSMQIMERSLYNISKKLN